jgi:hypothetical protein
MDELVAMTMFVRIVEVRPPDRRGYADADFEERLAARAERVWYRCARGAVCHIGSCADEIDHQSRSLRLQDSRLPSP